MSEVTGVENEEAPTSNEESEAAPSPENTGVSDDRRFEEMAKHKENVEQENQQWREWAQKAQAQNQALQAQLQHKQVEPERNADEDPVEAAIADSFGRDEEGQKAKKTFDLAVKHQIEKDGYITRQETQNMISQESRKNNGRLSSVGVVSNTLQALMLKGLLDQDGAGKIYQQVNARLASDPSLAERTDDVEHLVGSLHSRGMRSGELNKPTFTPPTNPLQPGGNAASADPNQNGVKQDAERLSDRFPRFKSMDPKKVESLLEKSAKEMSRP